MLLLFKATCRHRAAPVGRQLRAPAKRDDMLCVIAVIQRIVKSVLRAAALLGIGAAFAIEIPVADTQLLRAGGLPPQPQIGAVTVAGTARCRLAVIPAGQLHGISDIPDAAQRTRANIAVVVLPALKIHLLMMALLRPAGNDIDHPRQRIRAVDCRLRPAHHLNAIHHIGIQIGEIEAATAKIGRVIHRHAIYQHQRKIGFATAYGYRRQATRTSLLFHQQARQGLQQIGNRGLVQRQDLLCIEHRYR